MVAMLPRSSRHGEIGPKFWTFTTTYDPTDPAEVSIEALRERAFCHLEAVAKVYAKVFKPRGALGMFAHAELGYARAVHVHAVIWRPYVPDDLVNAMGRTGTPVRPGKAGPNGIGAAPGETKNGMRGPGARVSAPL